jgi:hypothetical protein
MTRFGDGCWNRLRVRKRAMAKHLEAIADISNVMARLALECHHTRFASSLPSCTVSMKSLIGIAWFQAPLPPAARCSAHLFPPPSSSRSLHIPPSPSLMRSVAELSAHSCV